MRVAIISDIHANLPALLALKDVLEQADLVLCLGDLIGYYCQVNEVLDYLRELEAKCILGNHDHFLLTKCPESSPEAVKFGIAWADRVISSKHRAWMATLPLVWGGTVAGKAVLAVHGSPWRPVADYLYSDSPKLTALKEFEFDLIAFGQTHRPFLQNIQRPCLINPGSVGQSRHAAGKASLAVWDTGSGSVNMLDRAYDPRPVAELAQKHGAGNWIKKHLLSDVE